MSLTRVHAPLCLLLLSITLGVAASPAAATTVPANDDFANASDLGSGLRASASGSNLWATAEAGEPGRTTGAAASSVWYRWTAPQTGVVYVSTCRSNFDTTLAVYRGSTVGGLGLVAASDDSCGTRSSLRFFAVAGTTYHVAVDGFRQVQGSIELTLRALTPPANDDLANAQDLGDGLPASASGTNRDATIEPREPDHDGQTALASVWYRWTAPANREIRVATCGSDFDTIVAVYVGPGLDALRPIASDDDTCRQQSVTRFYSRAGTTYHIAVTGFRRQLGSIRLRLTDVPRPARRAASQAGRH